MFEGLPKTCHVAVSKPNRNSLWGLGRYHGKASGTPSKAAAEGCEVLRPSKAARGTWKGSEPSKPKPAQGHAAHPR